MYFGWGKKEIISELCNEYDLEDKYLEGLGEAWRIILSWIFRKRIINTWTELNWTEQNWTELYDSALFWLAVVLSVLTTIFRYMGFVYLMHNYMFTINIAAGKHFKLFWNPMPSTWQTTTEHSLLLAVHTKFCWFITDWNWDNMFYTTTKIHFHQFTICNDPTFSIEIIIT